MIIPPLLKFIFKISRWVAAIAALYFGILLFRGGANLLQEWAMTMNMPWLSTLLYMLFGIAGLFALIDLILDLMQPSKY